VIIDAHMHVGVWDHADFLGRSCTVGDAVSVIEEAGISGAVMLPTDRCDNAGLLADMRAAIAGGFRGPLWFVPWVRPGEADLAWVDANAGAVAGLKIHPSLSRVRVTDEAFAPALAMCAEREWVVMVHCGRWQQMASYRFAVDAARAYPRARFVLCHAGGDTPPLATAAAEAGRDVANVWFEFSGVREYWVIERNVRALGAERYLMGSDYCLAHPLSYLGAVRGMDLTDGERSKILGENALAVFRAPLQA
jgi:predicted TIM-barrel fold metal-dependent hydrolase